MTFQTLQENDDNRYKNSPNGLPDEICSIWLGVAPTEGTPLVKDFIVVAKKLEQLGFVYFNGKVVIVEATEESRNV